MKRIFKFLMITMMAAMMLTIPAFAASGSISITLQDQSKNVPVKDAEFVAYKVADCENGRYNFTKEFADCGQNIDDLASMDANKLAEYALNTNVQGKLQTSDSNGRVCFADLEEGVYLLLQTDGDSGYYLSDPFIVNLPMTSSDGRELIYNIEASPKVEPVQPTPTPVPTKNPGQSLPQTGQLNWPVPILAVLGIAVFTVGFVIYKRSRGNE